jgi:hypothetical protein
MTFYSPLLHRITIYAALAQYTCKIREKQATISVGWLAKFA